MYWTDCSVSLERVMEMKRFQVSSPWRGGAQQEELRTGGRDGAVSGTKRCRTKPICLKVALVPHVLCVGPRCTGSLVAASVVSAVMPSVTV